jgi:hypothetical protein
MRKDIFQASRRLNKSLNPSAVASLMLFALVAVATVTTAAVAVGLPLFALGNCCFESGMRIRQQMRV